MSQKDDRFYVGYLPQAPKVVSALVKPTVTAILLLLPLLAGLIATQQSPFVRAWFEFGHVRNFEGIVQMKPYPTLLVPRNGQAEQAYSRYFLVVFGKFGAQQALAEMDGHKVQLQGQLIYRDNQTMIEIADTPIKVLDGPTAKLPPRINLGTHSLIGEIVDSKCFLGVMKPGNLKVHKSCAVRCISGGIPPVLAVKDASGNAMYYLLTGPDGAPIHKQILDKVAEPLQVSGKLFLDGNRYILETRVEDMTAAL